jgi:hypothetical protein
LVNIFRLDRGAAARYLANSGFSVAQQEAILASTHCRPAESFLVISGEMLADAKLWTRLGLWDVRRAYLARQTRRLREPEALRDLARLGYNAMEARALYANVAGLRTEANIDEFIAPRQQLISTDWVPCHDERGEMECDITVINTDGVARLEVFYDPAAPQNAWVRQGDRVGSVKALVIAGSRALDERVDSRAAFSDIGVLVDVAGERILVGSPLLIRSTLVRLFYLDGRYSSVFKPFSRKTTVAGEEVAAFTIDWND